MPRQRKIYLLSGEEIYEFIEQLKKRYIKLSKSS